MSFNLELPINSVSFGQISVNIMYELFKRGIAPNLFVIGQPDLSVYDKVGDDFKLYLQGCINKSLNQFNLDNKYLKLWHINSSCHKLSKKENSLITFVEVDGITETERNILNSFDKIFVTSSFTKQVFENNGVTSKIIFLPIGFDSLHYKRNNKKYFNDGSIVWSIWGKCEPKRKAHKQAVQGWIKKFGNNTKHRLHLHLHNPFLGDQMDKMYAQIFDNKPKPFNVNILGFQSTNSQMGECYNCTDITIDIGGNESLSIPSLTTTCLQKHLLIHNNNGVRDWANDKNSVLLESSGATPCYDGMFFHQGQNFNQGNFFTITDEEYSNGLDKVLERYNANPINEAGKELIERYSYKNAVDILLKELS